MTLATLPLLKLFLNNRPVELEKAPLAQKLMICTDKVLGEWAQLAGHRVEDPGQRPEVGLQTLIAAMHGPQSGLLSLATTPRLGTLLAVGATGDPSAASFSQEALLEFYRLLRECIIQDGLGADCRDFLLHTPSLANDEDLPSAPPSAKLKLLVNGQPLELRLWML